MVDLRSRERRGQFLQKYQELGMLLPIEERAASQPGVAFKVGQPNNDDGDLPTFVISSENDDEA
ncbi:hypothetical protein RS75_22250 [Rhizobium nepotum 39/7]|uniref:Uncharacterized protein n=1 Tax=Rhizobium nepotum 39/7 TaxID=1368418 RepID=A0ABR5CLS5_9HYPH|nr:hypothetical protein RS75_22250 [Rhizobium nepotum 39/7]